MSKNSIAIIIAVLVFVLIGSAAYVLTTKFMKSDINSFEECVAAGYPILETYPRQCSVNGRIFTEKTDVVATDTLDDGSGGADNMGIANPASKHCEENGGKLEIVTEGDGSYGICKFDDGTECEEWAFFRGECGKGEEKPEQETKAEFTSETLGISFSYPKEIFQLSETADTVSLTHTLKDYQMQSLKDGSLSPARDIVLTLMKNDENGDCSRVKEFGVEGENFQYTSFKGIKYYEGAEGEGIFYYCPQDSLSTFVVARRALSEGGGLWSEEPDYISSAKQEEITDEILNSLVFTI